MLPASIVAQFSVAQIQTQTLKASEIQIYNRENDYLFRYQHIQIDLRGQMLI